MANLNKIRELAGLPLLKESAAEYGDSAEFTDDMLDVSSMLKKIHDIVNSPKWQAWLDLTDHNYGTSTQTHNSGFLEALEDAKKQYDAVLDEINQADNG